MCTNLTKLEVLNKELNFENINFKDKILEQNLQIDEYTNHLKQLKQQNSNDIIDSFKIK